MTRNEGVPCHAIPDGVHHAAAVYRDGARIEAAFRKYFKRALPWDEIDDDDGDEDHPVAYPPVNAPTDEYDVLVCHANVIRFSLFGRCNSPPEGWLRLCTMNCSVTHVTVSRTGRCPRVQRHGSSSVDEVTFGTTGTGVRSAVVCFRGVASAAWGGADFFLVSYRLSLALVNLSSSIESFSRILHWITATGEPLPLLSSTKASSSTTMRAAAFILCASHVGVGLHGPRAAVAPRVAPVNMDASSLVTAYRELYEVGGVQVTADVQQFGPIAVWSSSSWRPTLSTCPWAGPRTRSRKSPSPSTSSGAPSSRAPRRRTLKRRTPNGGRMRRRRASRRHDSACACAAFTKTLNLHVVPAFVESSF